MSEGILSIIGNTPLVRLSRYPKGTDIRLYAKLEMLNPGGSVKDRPSARIIEEALRAGTIGPGSVIVESSSGNMGVGLAQACRYHGLKFICVVDSKTTLQNIRLLRAYGAEVDLVTRPDPATGELLQARIERVKTILRQLDDAFWPNKYENLDNPASHYYSTMREIATRVVPSLIPNSSPAQLTGGGSTIALSTSRSSRARCVQEVSCCRDWHGWCSARGIRKREWPDRWATSSVTRS